MGDFLTIVPSDWTQMQADIFDVLEVSAGWVESLIASGTLYPLSEAMQAKGVLVGEQTVAEARLFGDTLFCRIVGSPTGTFVAQ